MTRLCDPVGICCRRNHTAFSAGAEQRCGDTVELTFDDGSIDGEPLHISDFRSASARFGAPKAFESLDANRCDT